MKKIIFLTPRIENKKTFVNQSYYALFNHSDYIPIPLPFIFDEAKLYQILLQGCGLIICGGIDINPSYFKKDFIKSDYNNLLDQYDFLILKLALKIKLPILGICRGIQLINVYFRGTLYEDIEHHQDVNHLITLKETKNSIFTSLDSSFTTNSYHHQAVDELGKDLVIAGMSDDHIIEAIYSNKYPLYAIQWHCELMLDNHNQQKLVQNFFKVCEQYEDKKHNSASK